MQPIKLIMQIIKSRFTFLGSLKARVEFKNSFENTLRYTENIAHLLFCGKEKQYLVEFHKIKFHQRYVKINDLEGLTLRCWQVRSNFKVLLFKQNRINNVVKEQNKLK